MTIRSATEPIRSATCEPEPSHHQHAAIPTEAPTRPAMPPSAWCLSGPEPRRVEVQNTARLAKSDWNGHAPGVVLAYAQLARAVYTPSDTIDGWEPIANRSVSTGSGFKAAMFREVATGRVVAAYAGTDSDRLLDAARDMRTNVEQAFTQPMQYAEAIAFARIARREFGDQVILVGHSLGGGLAASASAHAGLRAVTFNSAGLGFAARCRLWLTGRLGESAQRVTNINVRDEVLSAPTALPTFGLGPRQIGHTIELEPAVAPPESRFALGSVGSLFYPGVHLVEAVRRLPQRFANHRVDAVISAIQLAQSAVR